MIKYTSYLFQENWVIDAPDINYAKRYLVQCIL